MRMCAMLTKRPQKRFRTKRIETVVFFNLMLLDHVLFDMDTELSLLVACLASLRVVKKLAGQRMLRESILEPCCMKSSTHLAVESMHAAEGNTNDVQNLCFVFIYETLAMPDIEVDDRMCNHAPVPGFGALPQNHLEFQLLQVATHVNECEEFQDAPQAAQICWSTQHDHFLTANQEDGQTTQIRFNVILVYATLVEPHSWFSTVLRDKLAPPCLQPLPLRLCVIVPRVRDKGIDIVEVRERRLGIKAWVGSIVGQILRSQHREL